MGIVAGERMLLGALVALRVKGWPGGKFTSCLGGRPRRRFGGTTSVKSCLRVKLVEWAAGVVITAAGDGCVSGIGTPMLS